MAVITELRRTGARQILAKLTVNASNGTTKAIAQNSRVTLISSLRSPLNFTSRVTAVNLGCDQLTIRLEYFIQQPPCCIHVLTRAA